MNNSLESLNKLDTIARNFWWSWNHGAADLFQTINPKLWQQSHNPVLTLKQTPKDEILKHLTDNSFLIRLERVNSELDNYLHENNTWFYKNYPEHQDKKVAYFCAEYGIHESLPIYSGGLGILAGDHVKSASDLGIPMVFVGLFYKNGYFTQEIDKQGQQIARFPEVNPADQPFELVRDILNNERLVSIDFPKRTVYARIWKANVGRCSLYLLDTDIDKNTPSDRLITSKLYAGNREQRLAQEIVLGIGGYKAIKMCGIFPDVFHINEGHSVLFQLERVRDVMREQNLTFAEAHHLCSMNCIFTTHTPVPAGNESFSLHLVYKYLGHYANDFGISWRNFSQLAFADKEESKKQFNLTALAINFSKFQNGVSQLHGQTASKMWCHLWPEAEGEVEPITSITNGVHVGTWMNPQVKSFLSQHLGLNWQDKILNQDYFEQLRYLPNNRIRDLRKSLKEKMIGLVKKQYQIQLDRNNTPEEMVMVACERFKPEHLTIGFARRFATYKRANLLLFDIERLKKLVTNKKCPVQIVFAGKSHPADKEGQQLIQEIYNLSLQPEFMGRIVILENYDMHIAKQLISGVDVWLNTPRRPMEACGTSGQKVCLNLGINCSVLDGWWQEGYNSKNGWIIGNDSYYSDSKMHDRSDANDLYQVMEQQIISAYYDGLPGVSGGSDRWLEIAKESMISNLSFFSSHRMLVDYLKRAYLGALNFNEQYPDIKFMKDKIEYLAGATSEKRDGLEFSNH